MALAKSPSAAVLAAKTHRCPLQEQRANGQGLGRPPIYRLMLLHFLAPGPKLPHDLWVNRKTLRRRRYYFNYGTKRFLGHPGFYGCVGILTREPLPLAGEASHAEML